MPCYDERNSPAYINADWERRTRILEQRIDDLTQIACEMGKVLRKHGLVNQLGLRAYSWLTAHERFDRKRGAK